ncbi:hypothetical protein JCM8097_008235 [Rhodosporidiobolus ruineniae]
MPVHSYPPPASPREYYARYPRTPPPPSLATTPPPSPPSLANAPSASATPASTSKPSLTVTRSLSATLDMSSTDLGTPASSAPAKRRSGPVIWGFDLSEMSFGAFSHKQLMDPKWHLRKERIITYQLAMLVCLAAECCATYSLSKYEDLQTHIENRFAPAHLYNNDIIDMEIVTIVMCVMVACLYGADFFFLVQFPRRRYPMWYQQTKKALAVTITSGVLAAAIGFTVVVARNSAKIEHVPDYIKEAATQYYYRPPLQYNKWAVNIAALCILWPGWVFCVIATIFMFMAAEHDRVYGTAPRGGNYPEAATSTPSTSNVPLATPPALFPSTSSTDPRVSSASGATGSMLPTSGGAYREGDKLHLPVPEGRQLAVQPTGNGLDLEMDHGTFEGDGRTGGVVGSRV